MSLPTLENLFPFTSHLSKVFMVCKNIKSQDVLLHIVHSSLFVVFLMKGNKEVASDRVEGDTYGCKLKATN